MKRQNEPAAARVHRLVARELQDSGLRAGVYVVEIVVPRGAAIEIGGLGQQRLRRGRYLYVGSGQRGLSKRIARHFARTKKKRWHIDYLAEIGRARCAAVWARGKEAECDIARAAADIWGVAIERFGAGDCHCRSHLIGPVPRGWLRELQNVVGQADAKIAGDEKRERRSA